MSLCLEQDCGNSSALVLCQAIDFMHFDRNTGVTYQSKYTLQIAAHWHQIASHSMNINGLVQMKCNSTRVKTTFAQSHQGQSGEETTGYNDHNTDNENFKTKTRTARMTKPRGQRCMLLTQHSIGSTLVGLNYEARHDRGQFGSSSYWSDNSNSRSEPNKREKQQGGLTHWSPSPGNVEIFKKFNF